MVILFSLIALERYRSGHNEAVLKTVCPKGRVGSNPTLSAEYKQQNNRKYTLRIFLLLIKTTLISRAIWRNTQAGRRGSPGKGVGR